MNAENAEQTEATTEVTTITPERLAGIRQRYDECLALGPTKGAAVDLSTFLKEDVVVLLNVVEAALANDRLPTVRSSVVRGTELYEARGRAVAKPRK